MVDISRSGTIQLNLGASVGTSVGTPADFPYDFPFDFTSDSSTAITHRTLNTGRTTPVLVSNEISTIETTPISYALNHSAERKTFIANGRQWVTWADTDGFQYSSRVMNPLGSWAAATIIGSFSTISYYQTLSWDGTYLHFMNGGLYYQAIPLSNGSINFGTGINTGLSSRGWSSICVNSSGYPVATTTSLANPRNITYAIATSTSGTSWAPIGTIDYDAIRDYAQPCLIALPNNELLCAYYYQHVDHYDVYAQHYTGGSWTEKTALFTGNASWMSMIYVNNRAILVGDQGNDIKAYIWYGGSWDGGTIAITAGQHPNITRCGNDVVVFARNASDYSQIKYVVGIGGTAWGTPAIFMDSTTTVQGYGIYSDESTTNGATNVVWEEGPGSPTPYSIQHLTYTHGATALGAQGSASDRSLVTSHISAMQLGLTNSSSDRLLDMDRYLNNSGTYQYKSDDFEWGSDGDHAHDSGGSITWTTSTTPPTISNLQSHNGTRSVMWTGSATQYIQCNHTAGYGYDITVWYYKETGGNTIRPIQHGNATHRFRLFIQGTGRVCCYTSEGIQYYSIHSLDSWHKLQIKNINWASATFDIWVDDALEHANTPMEVSGVNNGIFQATTEDNTSGKRWWLDDFEITPTAIQLGLTTDYNKTLIFERSSDQTTIGLQGNTSDRALTTIRTSDTPGTYQYAHDDFEWGNDGDNPNLSLGGIDWVTSIPAGCTVEIDTSKSYSGSRSLHIFNGTGAYPLARYDLNADSNKYSIKCRIYKTNNSWAAIYFFDGTKGIRSHWYTDNTIRYANATGTLISIGSAAPDTWHELEYKNIDFTTGYFDMWLDSVFLATCQMNNWVTAGDFITLYSFTTNSDVWFDDFEILPTAIQLGLSGDSSGRSLDMDRYLSTIITGLTPSQDREITLDRRLGNHTYIHDDFEWGNDGDSITTSGGGITWSTYKWLASAPDGDTVFDVDTAQYYTGTRSAHIHNGAAGSWHYISIPLTALSDTYSISVRIRYTSDTRWEMSHGGVGGARRIVIGINNDDVYVAEPSRATYVGYTHTGSTWAKFTITDIDFTNYTFSLYINDVPYGTYEMTTAGASTMNNLVGLFIYGANGDVWYDEFEVSPSNTTLLGFIDSDSNRGLDITRVPELTLGMTDVDSNRAIDITREQDYSSSYSYKHDDFEWGEEGTSVSTSGGGITWGEAVGVGGYIRITSSKSHSGTRCCHVHGANTPSYWNGPYTSLPAGNYKYAIKVYTTKSNGVPTIHHGNGSYCIYVGVDTSGNVYVYDGTTHDTGKDISTGQWGCLEVRGIDFATHQFDLYFDGEYQGRYNMQGSSSSDDILFLSSGGYNTDTYYDDVEIIPDCGILGLYATKSRLLNIFRDYPTIIGLIVNASKTQYRVRSILTGLGLKTSSVTTAGSKFVRELYSHTGPKQFANIISRILPPFIMKGKVDD